MGLKGDGLLVTVDWSLGVVMCWDGRMRWAIAAGFMVLIGVVWGDVWDHKGAEGRSDPHIYIVRWTQGVGLAGGGTCLLVLVPVVDGRVVCANVLLASHAAADVVGRESILETGAVVTEGDDVMSLDLWTKCGACDVDLVVGDAIGLELVEGLLDEIGVVRGCR